VQLREQTKTISPDLSPVWQKGFISKLNRQIFLHFCNKMSFLKIKTLSEHTIGVSKVRLGFKIKHLRRAGEMVLVCFQMVTLFIGAKLQADCNLVTIFVAKQ